MYRCFSTFEAQMSHLAKMACYKVALGNTSSHLSQLHHVSTYLSSSVGNVFVDKTGGKRSKPGI